MILARVIAGLYFHMKTGGVSGVLTRIREKFLGIVCILVSGFMLFTNCLPHDLVGSIFKDDLYAEKIEHYVASV